MFGDFFDNPLRMVLLKIFYGFIGSMSLYITAWNNFATVHDRLFPPHLDPGDSYDFIVIGAGTAGTVAAVRLSENFRVLLVEAGGEPYPLAHIPGFCLFLLNYPEVDWQYETVSQAPHACLGLKSNSSAWTQGKWLGGTSNTNYLIHSRGHPRDYDEIAKIVGDSQWNYDGVLPFFKKSETMQGPYRTTPEHGTDGPMNVQVPPSNENGQIFVNAAKELGYKQVDLNGRYTQGFDNIYYPTKLGRRHAPFQSYLVPIRKTRRNLTVLKYSHVTKILIRGVNNEAYGVEFDRHGERKTAYATKEVILSAGAISSPKILLLSGIGPKEQLESLKIPLIKDLPVGENVQDHISVHLGPFLAPGLNTPLVERDINSKIFGQFLAKGEGPLTTTGCEAMGFISSPIAKARGEQDWPDIQLIFLGVAVYKTFAKDLAHGFNFKEDVFNKYYENAVGKNSFFIQVSNARPIQRGHIKLTQNDPYLHPLIDPKYLQIEEDIKVIIEGVKTAIQIVENSTTFQKLGGKFTDQVFPGCENVPFRSDAYFDCYIRHVSITLHHIVGGCSMGPRDSPAAVVDPTLKVIGVERLRVIDTSVFPKVMVGNTMAPAVMLGEKGSDLIKQEWLSQRGL